MLHTCLSSFFITFVAIIERLLIFIKLLVSHFHIFNILLITKDLSFHVNPMLAKKEKHNKTLVL